MNEIKTFLRTEHQNCDQQLAKCEEQVSHKEWSMAEKTGAAFVHAMELHLAREEEVLFPAIEAATGMRGGPTAVMRLEHNQMRELLAQMKPALEGHNDTKFLGLSETLMILIQQHNLKEEQILYPMADQVLSSQKPDIVNRIQAHHSSSV